MNKTRILIALSTIAGLIMIIEQTKNQSTKALNRPLRYVANHDDIVRLFPTTPQEVNERVERYLKEMQEDVQAIIAVPDDKRTWDNTAGAFDYVSTLCDASIMYQILIDLELVSSDTALRDAVHAAILKIHDCMIDQVGLNPALYRALKAYVDGNAQHEVLRDDQRYFLQETMDDFKRHGLELSEEKRTEVSRLLKEISALELAFEHTIAQDHRTITVTRQDLRGLDDMFIESLKRTQDGDFILGVDYPTYHAVMENCTVQNTRKQLFNAFTNRAYPANEKVLADVIAKRDALANLLGFASYAHLDLDDAMAKTPERAQLFLDELVRKARVKENQEFDQLIKNLPEGVTLTSQGKLKPWDYAYVCQQYKKHYLALDETTIAHYFPMESAIEGMLAIYTKFLGIRFKEYSLKGLWSDEVRLIEVYSNQDTKVLGYLLLDLFPRAHKFTHACHNTTIPAIAYPDGRHAPALGIVVANFTKPTADKPALLHREHDVVTFFHEFGHALHAILGRTTIASFSGTHVKTDFVEMPSQMLEEWLWDPAMLKKISKHYLTGQPLSDALISKIQRLKHFDTGYEVQRQALFAQLSLACYAPGHEKSIYALWQKLYNTTVTNVAYDPDAHGYAAFGHLMGYGAKYYGYLWSKVFALDLFDHIKQHGLLDPTIGKKYIREILAKGGSQDPNILLTNFLGRNPNAHAFMKDMGLDEK